MQRDQRSGGGVVGPMSENPLLEIGFVIFAFALLAGFLLMNSSVEAEWKYSCNSGFIGVDAEWRTQNVSLDHLSIKNINGMKCSGEMKLKMPFILAVLQ